MTLPKQRKNESDTDYAVRLERAKDAVRERARKHYEANKEANREAIKERHRKYREANREAIKERHRKYREANREVVREAQRKYREANREVVKERKRKHYDTKVLAQAKGKPLRKNFTRAKRPAMLTRLILREAERFCLRHGFSLDSRFDTDVLRHAARLIRDSRELNGELNPWYCTDFLCEALISNDKWPLKLRKTLLKWAQA